jgi:hypothetical protein
MQFHRYTMERIRVLDAVYNIKAITEESVYKTVLDGFVKDSRDKLAGVVADMHHSGVSALADLAMAVNPMFNNVAETVDSANTTVQNAAQRVDESFLSTESSLNAEANLLDIARQALPDRVAATLTSLVNAVNTDAQDVARILSEDQTYSANILWSMSQQVAAFASTETARASTKAASLEALVSATPLQMSATLSTAVKAQVTSNNAQASTRAASMPSLAIAAQSGSTDTGTW